MTSPPRNNAPADVCLLLEGTYPYVLGGVSAWVDQIIRGLPDLSFSLYYIGARKSDSQKQHYPLPPNVITLEETYLHEPLPDSELVPAKLTQAERQRLYHHFSAFYLAHSFNDAAEQFWQLLDALGSFEGRFTFGNLSKDPEAWQLLQESYDAFCPEESFIDFFWTARFLHLPLWSLYRGLSRLPPARVYHSVSAGYAGLVGAIGAHTRNVPFLLTEHGIYTKERITEICQADWVYEPESAHVTYASGLGKLKQLWINLFLFLGQISYNAASRIVTLYEGNALTQVEFGADPSKIDVIPNGIAPAKFDSIRDRIRQRWNPEPPAKFVGFIGRVVPIKDVKTLLRAARLVCERCPNVQFLIAGPFSEDPAYFEDCQKIVSLLHIEDRVRFLGMQKLMEILPSMDVMVLTSISEGLPLVVLEAMAAGIPVVATDVGACRELIFGRTPADKALGFAGRLTKILSPQETAAALIHILQNPDSWAALGSAGRRRAEQFYTMEHMLGSYRQLYRSHIDMPPPKQTPTPGSHSSRNPSPQPTS